METEFKTGVLQTSMSRLRHILKVTEFRDQDQDFIILDVKTQTKTGGLNKETETQTRIV